MWHKVVFTWGSPYTYVCIWAKVKDFVFVQPQRPEWHWHRYYTELNSLNCNEEGDYSNVGSLLLSKILRNIDSPSGINSCPMFQRRQDFNARKPFTGATQTSSANFFFLGGGLKIWRAPYMKNEKLEKNMWKRKRKEQKQSGWKESENRIKLSDIDKGITHTCWVEKEFINKKKRRVKIYGKS